MDNGQKYILPPKLDDKIDKKTLVLDLDETLLHSQYNKFSSSESDIVLKIEYENEPREIHVLIRPGAKEFLRKMNKFYELVIFTASVSKYASPLINLIDEKGLCTHKLYRENCSLVNTAFIKDLTKLGRDLKDIIIIDNSPSAYSLNKENGIPIVSWFEDKRDRELFNLIPILEFLSSVPDVREFIPKLVINNEVSYLASLDIMRKYKNSNKIKKNKIANNNKNIKPSENIVKDDKIDNNINLQENKNFEKLKNDKKEENLKSKNIGIDNKLENNDDNISNGNVIISDEDLLALLGDNYDDIDINKIQIENLSELKDDNISNNKGNNDENNGNNNLIKNEQNNQDIINKNISNSNNDEKHNGIVVDNKKNDIKYTNNVDSINSKGQNNNIDIKGNENIIINKKDINDNKNNNNVYNKNENNQNTNNNKDNDYNEINKNKENIKNNEIKENNNNDSKSNDNINNNIKENGLNNLDDNKNSDNKKDNIKSNSNENGINTNIKNNTNHNINNYFDKSNNNNKNNNSKDIKQVNINSNISNNQRNNKNNNKKENNFINNTFGNDNNKIKKDNKKNNFGNNNNNKSNINKIPKKENKNILLSPKRKNTSYNKKNNNYNNNKSLYKEDKIRNKSKNNNNNNISLINKDTFDFKKTESKECSKNPSKSKLLLNSENIPINNTKRENKAYSRTKLKKKLNQRFYSSSNDIFSSIDSINQMNTICIQPKFESPKRNKFYRYNHYNQFEPTLIKLKKSKSNRNNSLNYTKTESSNRFEKEKFRLCKCISKQKTFYIKRKSYDKSNFNNKTISVDKKDDKNFNKKDNKSISNIKYSCGKKRIIYSAKTSNANIYTPPSPTKSLLSKRKKTPILLSPKKENNYKNNRFLGNKTPKINNNNKYNNIINYRKNEDIMYTTIIDINNRPSPRKIETKAYFIKDKNYLLYNRKNIFSNKPKENNKIENRLPWGWGGNTKKYSDSVKKINYNLDNGEKKSIKIYNTNSKLLKSPKKIKKNNNNISNDFNNDLIIQEKNTETNEIKRKRGLSSNAIFTSGNKNKEEQKNIVNKTKNN